MSEGSIDWAGSRARRAVKGSSFPIATAARMRGSQCDVGGFERVWTTPDLVALLIAQVGDVPEMAPFVTKFSTIASLVADGHSRLACQVLPNFASKVEELAGKGKVPVDRAAAIARTVQDIERSVGC